MSGTDFSGHTWVRTSFSKSYLESMAPINGTMQAVILNVYKEALSLYTQYGWQLLPNIFTTKLKALAKL